MRHSSPPIRVNSGFTLIEVIIAISILVVIVGISYASLTQIIKAKTLLDDERDSKIVANAVMGRLTRELQLAEDDVGLLPPRDKPDDKPLPTKFNLIGEQNTLDSNARGDTLRFMALEAGQYLPDGGTHAGIVQVAYRVEPDPDAPTRQSESSPQTYVLVREEIPNMRPIKKAFEKAMIFPITNRLVSLTIRYFDSANNGWVDEWGKDTHIKLPGMIQITLQLVSPRGKVESYSTITGLPRGKPQL